MCHKDEDNQRRHAEPRPPLDPPATLLSPSPGPTQGRAWPLQVTLTLTLTLTRYAYLRPLAAMWRSSDPTLRHVLGLPSSGWRVVRASGLRTGEAAARGLRVKPPAELVLPPGADELVLDLALQVRVRARVRVRVRVGYVPQDRRCALALQGEGSGYG